MHTTTIFHIDSKARLRPGMTLTVAGRNLTGFGQKITFAIKRAGLPLPRKGEPERLDAPTLRTLHPMALREYLTECARHRVGVPYARWNVLYAADSAETAKEIARRMVLPPGRPIYRATVEGWVFRHDMSWLDHDLTILPYDKRVEWYREYWENETNNNPANLQRRSQPPLTELLVQGQITIDAKVGQTE